jgi:hypothetical protein
MVRMIALTPVSLDSVAVIGAHCDEIAIDAGATLIEIGRDTPMSSFTHWY